MAHPTRQDATPARARSSLLLPALFTLLAAGTIAGMVVATGADRREETLPAGTVLIAALDHAVSARDASVGDLVRLETTEPVSLGTDTVIPVGAWIHGEVTEAADGARVVGTPALTLRFTELEAGGARYRIDSEPFRVHGTDDALARSAGMAGGLLGGVLGGGSGAVGGARAGAVLDTGVALATDGDDLVLPAGARLRIHLAAPVAVTYRSSAGG
jgi:hypothetical protein